MLNIAKQAPLMNDTPPIRQRWRRLRVTRRSLRQNSRQNPHLFRPAAADHAPELLGREWQIFVVDARPARTEKFLEPNVPAVAFEIISTLGLQRIVAANVPSEVPPRTPS